MVKCPVFNEHFPISLKVFFFLYFSIVEPIVVVGHLPRVISTICVYPEMFSAYGNCK